MNDPRDALLGVYQADRSDLTAIYLASIAVLAFGATIAAASFAYLSTAQKPSPLIALAGPTILSGVILYNAVVSGLARVRQQSAEAVETAMYELGMLAPLAPIKEQVLVRAGARVLDFPGQRLGSRKLRIASFLSTLANLLSNAVIFFTGVAFVIYGFSFARSGAVGNLSLTLFGGANGLLLLLTAGLYLVGHLAGGLNIRRAPGAGTALGKAT